MPAPMMSIWPTLSAPARLSPGAEEARDRLGEGSGRGDWEEVAAVDALKPRAPDLARQDASVVERDDGVVFGAQHQRRRSDLVEVRPPGIGEKHADAGGRDVEGRQILRR